MQQAAMAELPRASHAASNHGSLAAMLAMCSIEARPENSRCGALREQLLRDAAMPRVGTHAAQRLRRLRVDALTGWRRQVTIARPDRTAMTESSGYPNGLDRTDLLVKVLPDLRNYVRMSSSPHLRRLESTTDLVQSACREVLQQMDDLAFQSEGQFRAWMLRTAWRKIIERVRHHRAQKRAADRVEGASSWSALGLADAAPTPSEDAEADEFALGVETSLQRLRPSDREIVYLLRIAQLSVTDVAQAFGVSEGAIRVRLHRALSRLAELLPDPPP
jgi:RNA polymerase sigma-70 factor (ECF subfamily)